MLIPRIITVDPHSVVSRMVRAATELFDHPVVQVDVPGSLEALDELNRGGYQLLVTALHVDRHMKGFELALRARQISSGTAVIILADGDDLEELDDETRAESPFVYMRRPVDAHHFLRVVHAGLRGQNVFAAAGSPDEPAPVTLDDLGPVPALDLKAGQVILDTLLTDVGALAVVLSSREGAVLLERGAAGYIDRARLTRTLLPLVQTTMSIGGLVGGHASTLQFFDGDTYDVFVLSVGYHHFLSLVFDGQAGIRQFGAVTRFGRRAVEDLKVLVGSAAFVITPATSAPPVIPADVEDSTPLEVEIVEHVALKAETWESEPVVEAQAESMSPIVNFDPSILDLLSSMDDGAADDLFSPERMAEITNESRRNGGPLSYEEARELGIVP